MIVEINGQQVELDDSFGSMTPAQQESMINEVASHMGQNTQNEPQRSEPPQSSDSINPVTGAIYGGMIGAIPATAIGATNALGAGAKVLGNAFRDANTSAPASGPSTVQEPIPYPQPVQPAMVEKPASMVTAATQEAPEVVTKGAQWAKGSTGTNIPGAQMKKKYLDIGQQMAETIGHGGELAGGEIKNGVMRGPKSLAEMKAEMAAKLAYEAKVAQAIKDAEITNAAQRRAVDYLNSKQVAPKPTMMQKVGQLGEHLTPTGIAGKTLNSIAPILSMAGAGEEGVDAYNRFAHGDYGRGIISGLGALGSAASMLPNKYARGLGTAAATTAPVINAGLDRLLGREGYADGGTVQHFDKGGSALNLAKTLAQKFGYDASKIAKNYPDVIPPILAQDAKTGKEFLQKTLSPEALAVQKARVASQKEINAGNYQPYFDINQRKYVDPSLYPLPDKTLTTSVPKRPETLAKFQEKANNPEAIAKLNEAFLRGNQRPAAKDWYAMGQLHDAFVNELGPEEGVKQFKARFADPMGATTGGQDPNSNLMTAAYTNFIRQKGLDIPQKGYDVPYPIGGRFIGGNLEQARKLAQNGALSVDTPKRYNFSGNFLGHKDIQTLDEQMMSPFGVTAPEGDSYGVYQAKMNELAKQHGVDPVNFQDVTWAGLKDYPGKPMIQEINEMLARTSKITGEPQADVLKGFIRGDKPMYGLTGLGALGGASQFTNNDETQ